MSIVSDVFHAVAFHACEPGKENALSPNLVRQCGIYNKNFNIQELPQDPSTVTDKQLTYRPIRLMYVKMTLFNAI